VACIALATASTAHAAFPGDNGRIAFSGGFGCGYESGAIASMKADGTRLRRLIDCDLVPSAPTWSPDGRALLFSTYATVWWMGADGVGRRRLFLGGFAFSSAPSFAPDGRHYAYVYKPDDGLSSYIRRADLGGTGDRQLRAGGFPLWSPKGRRIAYFRKGIWIMNARTGERLRRVASRDFQPLDWSPDARQLLCLRYLRDSVGGIQDADLFVVRADGTGRPRRLTRTPRRSEHHAAWSPDGRRIVFAALTAPGRFQHQRSIWTMRSDGTHQKRIRQEPPYAQDDEDRVAESLNEVSWQPLD
jgi:Tol biopolymer transport system component